MSLDENMILGRLSLLESRYIKFKRQITKLNTKVNAMYPNETTQKLHKKGRKKRIPHT